MFSVPPFQPIPTGKPVLDAVVQVLIVTASVAVPLAQIIKGRSDRRRERTRARIHIAAPVPMNRARKALDALRRRA